MKKLIPHFFALLSKLSPYLAAKVATKLFTHPRRKARSDEEMSFLATGKRISFKSGRKARTWGEGEVVWLVHGWESRGSTFYKLIPKLVEKGCQVIAWDGPAHGDSPGSTSSVPENAQGMVEDIEQGLVGKPVAFIGHSFGGATLAVVAKIYALPQKVVIISAPTVLKNVFTNFTKMVKLSELATQKFINISAQHTGYTLDDASLTANDLSLKSQVLIIHDKGDDVIAYSDFEAIKEKWQGGKFVTTEGLGHRLTIKDDKLLNDIVGFIAD
jgi:pimeloyl-ACP methyl ester carboxylesterase